MPSKPTAEPVPDDEAPERVVADPGRQESGEHAWAGRLFAGVADEISALAEEWTPRMRTFVASVQGEA